MVLEVKRKTRESNQGLIRRFTQKVRRSGVQIEARKNRFKNKTKSKQAKKKAALKKEESRKKYQILDKLGKLERRGRFERGRR